MRYILPRYLISAEKARFVTKFCINTPVCVVYFLLTGVFVFCPCLYIRLIWTVEEGVYQIETPLAGRLCVMAFVGQKFSCWQVLHFDFLSEST